MRAPTCGAIALLLTGCGGPTAGQQAAMDAFAAFQQALRAGDRAAVAALLTDDSQPALAQLPWAQLRTQAPLQIDGAERCGIEWWVSIRDPGDHDRRGCFVVVPEHGRLRVDLLASMQHHAEITTRPTAPTFEPRDLTPDEVARVQAMGYSAPPR